MFDVNAYTMDRSSHRFLAKATNPFPFFCEKASFSKILGLDLQPRASKILSVEVAREIQKFGWLTVFLTHDYTTEIFFSMNPVGPSTSGCGGAPMAAHAVVRGRIDGGGSRLTESVESGQLIIKSAGEAVVWLAVADV